MDEPPPLILVMWGHRRCPMVAPTFLERGERCREQAMRIFWGAVHRAIQLTIRHET